MTALKFSPPFYGTAPRVAPRSLLPTQAQAAIDLRLFSGELEGLGADVADPWLLQKAGLIKSIYRLSADTATPKWMMWLNDVDAVRGQVAENTTDKTYYTGDGTPKKVDALRVAANGIETPLEMGVPAPAIALSATATPNIDDGLNEITNYVFTFVTAWGEEGAQCPASTQTKYDTSAVSISLTNIGVAPAGAYNIQNKRIYRDVSGANGSQYQFVAEIPVAQATFIDTFDSSAIASKGALVTSTYDTPPSTMQGLRSFPNGVMIAFDGSDLLFSEPFLPYAWPIEYRRSVDYPIVGIGVYGNSVLVTTTNHPYIFTGIHPSAMSSIKLEERQSCVSKRSVVEIGNAVAYASPDGIVLSMGNSAVLATDKYMDQKTWQSLNPSSIHAYYSEGRYIGFYDATATGGAKGGFILSLRDPEFGFVWLSNHYVAGFTDDVNDALYLVTEAPHSIVQWGAGNALNYTWKSGIRVLPRPVNFSCAQVIASAYPVTVKFFADAVLQHTQTVQDKGIFRLPAGFMADEWEVEMSGNNAVHSIEMSESIEDLRVI